MEHYELALKKVKRRLSIETIAKYRNFEENLKYWFCFSVLYLLQFTIVVLLDSSLKTLLDFDVIKINLRLV